jgi:diguanylate cyclase (GGDEF)-like protein
LEAHAALLLLCDEDEVFLHGALDTLTAYAQLAGALLIQSAERQRLNDYATFDHLTGLLNRRALAEILEREHVRAERYNRAYSVLFFDLDHFKSINSSYGHAVGDLALQHVARLVGKALREGDWLGRWGGEEFLCILPDTSEAKAERIAQRVREQLASQPLRAQENTVTLTLSIGVACFPQDGYDINTLLVHADAGLALAKGSGRNCVRRYNPTEAA